MHGDEPVTTCQFRTLRLDVVGWRSAPLPAGRSLPDVVMTLLTARTTTELPTSWQGDYDLARATAWIADRESESAVSIATERKTGRPVGLIILFEAPCKDGSGCVDIRLGYLLAEAVWRRGIGTELVAGFVDWCRSVPRIRSIAGGVGQGNVASARTLVKNGFVAVGPAVEGNQLYELDLSID